MPQNPSACVILVNGILTAPGSAHAWTDRGVTILNTRYPWIRAEKLEYLAGPLTRRIQQRERVENLCEMISAYTRAGYPVHLVGHSNGADIICRALGDISRFWKPSVVHNVHSVHLIAAATERDGDKNNLTWYMDIQGNRPSVHLYRGGRDRALRFARLTGHLLRPFGLGYGTLGLEGPSNMPADWYGTRLIDHYQDDYGHGTWFHPAVLERTLTTIANSIASDGQPGTGDQSDQPDQPDQPDL